MSLLTRLFGKAPQTADEEQSITPSAVIEPSPPREQPVAIDDEPILKAALDSRDTGVLARLVIDGSSTRIRQLAAQAIEDPAQLRQLLRQAKGGRDKNVYRILRHKCDALLASEREIRQTEDAIEARCASLERHSKRPFDDLFTPTLEHYEAEWKALAPKATPDAIARAQSAIERGRETIAQYREKVAAQAAQVAAAAQAAAQAQLARSREEEAAAISAAAAAAQREADEKVRAEHAAAQALAIGRLGGLIRKAGAALRDGSTGRAAGLRRAIEESVQHSPPLPAHLTGQLQHLDAKLNELKDWKDYAAAPKRTQLIEAMEALVDSKDDPEELAVEIKRLQDDWKTISKGVGADTEADWQRFHQAAQKAYEPCRTHFEAQAQRRRENLERRLALIARLTAFEAGQDWQQADWPLVVTALRESRLQWRSHSPVHRSAGKLAQENFDSVVQRLQERLNGEYAKNISAKQSLIARAQKALAGEDIHKAVDDIKHLQLRWKTAGIVPREEDARLWQDFRQHCDAVFQKRQHEQTDYYAGLEAHKGKAVALCMEVERIASLSGQDLANGAHALAELKEAFDTLEELPRADARDLQRRLERALEDCERSIARQKSHDRERSWSDLFEAANQVRAYRLAVAANQDPGEREALKQAAEQFMTQVQQWPKGGLQAIKSVLASPGIDDVDANEMALRKLCIRAEILAEQPTPEFDQPLRREYQMQRLIQGMGQGSSTDEGAVEKLVLEWVAVGASRAEVYAALLARFAKCRSAAGKRRA